MSGMAVKSIGSGVSVTSSTSSSSAIIIFLRFAFRDNPENLSRFDSLDSVLNFPHFPAAVSPDQ